MRRPRRPNGTSSLIFGTPIVILMGFFLLRAGYRVTLAGNDPASKAVEAQIEASKSGDCNSVFAIYSARTQQLMLNGTGLYQRGKLPREMTVKSVCSYAEEGDLDDYLPNKVRRIEGNDRKAVVGAKYKYDRFFGFFGEGETEGRFVVVHEGRLWKIDHTESVDPNSRTNLNRRAMSLLQQLYTAERYLFAGTGSFSSRAPLIQQQLPGYKFPSIHVGIADQKAMVGHLFVQLGSRPNLACLSTKSGTGILVMIKVQEGTNPRAVSYQYGKTIPPRCDSEALARRYHGSSSGIR